MGWTEKEATYYKKNGNIDVKKEVEALLTGGKDVSRVLAIRNVGSVYYVAVKSYKEYVPGPDGKGTWEDIPEEKRPVWCGVILTSTRDRVWFGYKDMDETEGPGEDNCPESILTLLTPTDNEFAKAWRKRCWEHVEEKKRKRILNRLDIGSIITFSRHGKTIRAIKRYVNGWKYPRWCDGQYYYPITHIPGDFTIEKAMPEGVEA